MSTTPAARQRHRAAKRIPNFTDAEYFDLYLRQNRTCAYCGRHLALCDATVDHGIPLSRGGNNAIGNIFLVDLTCNQSKGSKTLDEYLGYPAARALRKRLHGHETHEAALFRRLEAELLHDFVRGDPAVRAHARYALALLLAVAGHPDVAGVLREADERRKGAA